MLLTATVFLATTVDSSVGFAASAYFWLLFIVALLTIVGGSGGLFAFVRYLRKQGVREDKLDRVITVVLGDPEANPPKPSRFDTIDFAIADVKRQQNPNGLGSNEIGDIAKRTELIGERTEKSVTALHSLLDQHIGSDEAIQGLILGELKKKQDKEPVV